MDWTAPIGCCRGRRASPASAVSSPRSPTSSWRIRESAACWRSCSASRASAACPRLLSRASCAGPSSAARQTVEWTAFVWELLQKGRLRMDFQRLDLSVGHHIPCHLKALGGPPRGPGLLALVPGLRVRTIDVSCSGMAGTYGLQAANYETSLEAGRPMLEELDRPGVLFGSTECSTCRLQMEDGAGKRTLHPAQYLALAYGLMPELAGRLAEPIRERVL